MATTFGGRGKMAPRRRTQSIGAATTGSRIQKKKRRIRTADLLRPCLTIRRSMPMLKRVKAYRSAQSFSADAAATRCRSCFRRSIGTMASIWARRSEEHTSELQSRFDLVCRLLLEKKKKINKQAYHEAESDHSHIIT